MQTRGRIADHFGVKGCCLKNGEEKGGRREREDGWGLGITGAQQVNHLEYVVNVPRAVYCVLERSVPKRSEERKCTSCQSRAMRGDVFTGV